MGERGDVIPLGFVADDERFRVRVVVLATRVAIEGVDGDEGELRFSLGVEGEIIDVPRLAIVEPFEAVAFDECGTISISSDGISASFS